MQARVTVVGPLPLVKASLSVPRTSVAAASPSPESVNGQSVASPEAAPSSPSAPAAEPPPSSDEPGVTDVAALKGQVLLWRLLVSNTGTSEFPASTFCLNILLVLTLSARLGYL